jgi:hypothetical protein
VRFLKKYLEEHPVDLIVSTGPPQSMHLIGRELARATGLPWIADFRDPWTKIFYFKHLSMTRATERWHKRMEKKVLDEATAVVAVSPLVSFQSRHERHGIVAFRINAARAHHKLRQKIGNA